MFAAERFLTVFFVFGILFGKNPVNGSRDSCPKSAVIDLTKETLDSSGAVTKSSILFPREVIQYDYVGRFGCMCDIRICQPFCCPFDHAASSKGCVKDNYTTNALEIEDSLDADGVYGFVDDPCHLSFVKNTSMKTYKWIPDRQYDIYLRKYCRFRKINSMEYFYGICLRENILLRTVFSDSITTWDLTCDAIRVFFIMVTLIVYSVTPELKNLQGLLLRCYIGSELTAYALSHSSFIWIDTPFTLLYRILFWFIGFVMYTFNAATLFWLTVINFDVWWKFRRFQSNRLTNVKEYKKTSFLRYSIYTWIRSFIIASIKLGCVIWMDAADPLTKATYRPISLTTICSMVLPCVISVFFSIDMYITTALTIRRQKNEIAHAVNDADRHRKYDVNKQRFNLYLGLLTLMGCYKVFCITIFFWDNFVYQNFYRTLGAVHGFFTFLLFVWKEDVKRSFWSQVIKILCFCRRPHSTSVDEEKNEIL